MDIFKFLLSLEEFIYEILTGIFFAPKTLVKVIFSPSWIYGYVVNEIKKDEKTRFGDYVSPILLFVTLVVVPFSYLSFSPMVQLIDQVEVLKNLLNDDKLRVLCVGMDMLAFPLFISIFIHLKGKIVISKTALKPTLYSQCYVFVPPQILSLVLCYLHFVKNFTFTYELWFTLFSAIAPPLWIISRIGTQIKLQLSLKWRQAIVLAFGFYLIAAIGLFLSLYLLLWAIL